MGSASRAFSKCSAACDLSPRDSASTPWAKSKWGLAIAAIDAVGGSKRFKVTHDTFHHFVAGEKDVFADRTGLIHVSGVTDKKHTIDTMRDAQRVLVDGNDMIDNRGQVQRLMAAGYKGYVSFEPFAAEVHKSKMIARELARSMDYLEV